MRNRGNSCNSRPGIEIEVTREPLGVVGLITPWNFPLAIPAWKIAPALAFGNCIVFKPAELVPGSPWALADIVQRAGLPPGVLNLVMGRGSKLGAAMASAPGIDAISFTGSRDVGPGVAAAAVQAGARVQLEMGGKNPLIASTTPISPRPPTAPTSRRASVAPHRAASSLPRASTTASSPRWWNA